MNKISIIVPIYNTEKKMMDNCIISLINQTYKNTEIILIDDGSENWCKQNLKKYSSNKKIKIIEQNNSGVSAARNRGIKESSGDWIMFVDADDYLKLDCCDKFIKKVKKYPDTDIIIAKCYLDNDGIIEEVLNYYDKDINEKVITNLDEKKELLNSILVDKSKYNYIESVWAKLFKKSFLIENNLKLSKKLKLGEDCIFMYEAYSKASKIVYINDYVYYYYINLNSITNKFNENIINNYYDNLISFTTLFKKKNIITLYDDLYYYGSRQICKIITKYFCNLNNKKKYKELKKEYFDLIGKEPYKTFIKKVKYKDLDIYKKFFYICIKAKCFIIPYSLVRLKYKNNRNK